jgi:hypothetical protein
MDEFNRVMVLLRRYRLAGITTVVAVADLLIWPLAATLPRFRVSHAWLLSYHVVLAALLIAILYAISMLRLRPRGIVVWCLTGTAAGFLAGAAAYWLIEILRSTDIVLNTLTWWYRSGGTLSVIYSFLNSTVFVSLLLMGWAVGAIAGCVIGRLSAVETRPR